MGFGLIEFRLDKVYFVAGVNLDKPIFIVHFGRGYLEKPCLAWRVSARTDQLWNPLLA